MAEGMNYRAVNMRDGSGVNGSNYANGVNIAINTGYNETNFGGATDLWSPARTWTPATVNDSTFGVQFGFNTVAGASVPYSISVDRVVVTVYFTGEIGQIQSQTRCRPLPAHCGNNRRAFPYPRRR